MDIKEGDRLKSLLTERAYRVKKIDNISVILESIEGTSNVWTEKENLRLFYEKMENMGDLESSGNFYRPDSTGRRNV
jgi:hypothetical protein